MSTDEFLSKLDYDQLQYAKERAEYRIKELDEEKMHIIWVVEGVFCNDSAFVEDEFNLAKNRLVEIVISDEFRSIDVDIDHPKITKRLVRESEVDEWLSLNN